MISIVIAIGIFRFFQKLAVKYDKTHWKYGLFGMSVFFGIQLAFGFILGIAERLFKMNEVNFDFSGFSLLNIFGIIIALIAVWLVYRQLEKSWKKDAVSAKISEIEEIGKKNN